MIGKGEKIVWVLILLKEVTGVEENVILCCSDRHGLAAFSAVYGILPLPNPSSTSITDIARMARISCLHRKEPYGVSQPLLIVTIDIGTIIMQSFLIVLLQYSITIVWKLINVACWFRLSLGREEFCSVRKQWYLNKAMEWGKKA